MNFVSLIILRSSCIILTLFQLSSCGKFTNLSLDSNSYQFSPQHFINPQMPVWIDTDLSCDRISRSPEVDDCLALHYAFDRLNVIGISFAAGNTSSRIAETIFRKQFAATAPKSILVSNKVSDIIQHIRKHRNVAYASLGGLSNFGELLAADSSFKSNLKLHLAVMGCDKNQRCLQPRGSLIQFRDLNYVTNKLATRKALASGVPTILVPFEAASHVPVKRTDLRHMDKTYGFSSELMRQTNRWVTIWKLISVDAGFYPFDLVALGLFNHPEMYKCHYVHTAKFQKKYLYLQANKKQLRSTVVLCPKVARDIKPRLINPS